ncbi:hypothetical protein LJC31_01025 [Synergistaceae bacterium OttesenSCG-928-I11]|nr:hypothetical protein [Synergistaceae bacterium OttesenSCG-928-I11]
MKKICIFVVALLVFVFSFAAVAFAGTIMIKNNTGVTIEELYISDSGTEDWEEDVLGNQILEHGETLRIQVDGSYQEFDIAIVTEAGEEATYMGLPGSAKNITLNQDVTATW